MNYVNYIDQELLNKPATANNLYDHSPFKDVRDLSPAAKGKRYEAIVANVLVKLGYQVDPRENTGHDLIIDGVKEEVKGSTLNGNEDFNFMQIRLNDDWDAITFAAFWPQAFKLYRVERKDIINLIEQDIIIHQHGGSSSKDDTYILVTNDPGSLEGFVQIESKVEKPAYGKLKVV